MTKYKNNRKAGVKTVISVHIYIDEELFPAFTRLPNKTRFVNDAIREKIERDGQVLTE